MRLLITLITAATLSLAPTAGFAKDKKMNGPEVVEMADISVGLSGLVCDFCSIALNKTFKKRDEVRGTYVDLDTKLLSVALNEGETLANEEIVKLVKKAGYSTTKITRKDGSEFIPPAKS
ncbi:heavy-metal-associated domain-containing protein [Hellea balneolensis]|uniref:heavy-metal-associated domain-containing protein n=1 Tax=Hellea balneolensis TaxID=287478 RepID=UPI000416C96B|nr:cation transporter [Hellea balneolensis]